MLSRPGPAVKENAPAPGPLAALEASTRALTAAAAPWPKPHLATCFASPPAAPSRRPAPGRKLPGHALLGGSRKCCDTESAGLSLRTLQLQQRELNVFEENLQQQTNQLLLATQRNLLG